MFRTTRIGVAIAFALGATAAIAQTPAPQNAMPPNVMFYSARMSQQCAPPVGIAGRRAGTFNIALDSPAEVVEDAPYSGVGTTEVVNTLADGNRIVHKNTMRYYRDSAGRTRTEYQMAAVGPFTLDEARSVVTINDPVAGKHYVLHEGMKRADVFSNDGPPPDPTETPMAGRAGVKKFVLEKRGAGGAPPDVVFFAGPATSAVRLPPGAGCAPEARKLPQSVSLGERVIEGIKTVGSSLEFTLAAGEVGNEQPIVVRSEQWFSPELRVVVASTHRDPLAGDTTYRLEQISRAEPDPSLFTMPKDYAANEMAGLRQHVVGFGATGIIPLGATEALAQPPGVRFGIQFEDAPQGASVMRVQAGSVAERAGLRSGDVITKFKGQDIRTSMDVVRTMQGMAAGTKTPVTVVRDGKPMVLNAQF
jgi:hypothetical protein